MNNLQKYILFDLINFICSVTYVFSFIIYSLTENLGWVILAFAAIVVVFISMFVKYIYAFKFVKNGK